MVEDANIMVGLSVSCVDVDECAMMVQNDSVIHCKCFFLPLNHAQCDSSFHGL
jgi:hypothetical protein